MSPSHKLEHPSSTPPGSDMAWQEDQTPRKSSITSITSPRSSSIPTLPDVVHKAPSAGSQGNFLHTLLVEEKLEKAEEKEQEEKEQEQKEEQEGVQVQEKKAEGASSKRGSISGRTVSTKKKGKGAGQEGQGRRQSTTTDDRASKNLPTDTLTTSWSGAANSSPKGQRRRRSRDNGPSGRRLSGPPLPSKKKTKRRLSQGYDPTQLPSSHRRFSSPVAPALARSSKLLDLSLKIESDLVLRNKLEEETSLRTDSDSTDLPAHDTEECTSESEQIPSDSENPRKDSSDSEKPTDSSNILSDIDEGGSDLTKAVSDRKELQTVQSGNSRPGQMPASSATDPVPLTSRSSQATATTSSAASTPWTQDNVPSIQVSENKTPIPAEPSDPFSQWTTCRALEDSDDESDIESDNDDNISRGPSRMSEVDTHDFHNFDHSSYPFNDLFNRVGSSNPMRRKRPLLLPPIMLPPLHTVKPTPLIYRDEVPSVTPRTRRSLSEAEWEKLRDCRYLRIRTWRRSLEV